METVLRGMAVYGALLIIMRLSGRRTLAQMTPFDLILLLIVSETTQQALLGGEDYSLTTSILLMVTLFTLNIALAWIKNRSPLAERLIDGVPILLVCDGRYETHALKQARINEGDVLEAARQQGVATLDEIRYAVLEVSGQISIIPKKQ